MQSGRPELRLRLGSKEVWPAAHANGSVAVAAAAKEYPEAHEQVQPLLAAAPEPRHAGAALEQQRLCSHARQAVRS
jgi:hypothetical protein